MRIILFEFKKLICSKLFVFSTIIVLGLFAFMTASKCLDGSSVKDAADFAEYAASLPNNITDVIIEQLRQKNNAEAQEYFAHMANGDVDYVPPKNYFVESRLLAQADYAEQFAEDMTDYVTENLRLKGLCESESERAMYQKVIDIYNRSVNIKLIDGVTAENFFMYIHMSFSWQAVLLGPMLIVWAAMLTAYLLCCERGSGTDGVICAAYKGRGALYFKKLCAISVTVLAAVLVMFAAELICASCVFKIDLSAPIQSVGMFKYCQYKLTILGMYVLVYIMLFCAMMTGVFISSAACVLAAYPTRGVVAGFILGIGAWQAVANMRYLAQVSPSSTGLADNVRTFFPLYLISPSDYLTSFDYTRIFGIPVSRLYVVFASATIIGVICMAFSAKFYGRSADIRWKAKLSSLIKSSKATKV